MIFTDFNRNLSLYEMSDILPISKIWNHFRYLMDITTHDCKFQRLVSNLLSQYSRFHSTKTNLLQRPQATYFPDTNSPNTKSFAGFIKNPHLNTNLPYKRILISLNTLYPFRPFTLTKVPLPRTFFAHQPGQITSWVRSHLGHIECGW